MNKTYSFLSIKAAIVGPGGAIPLGDGSGASDEGISTEFLEETDRMSVGADGEVMHSLNASKAGRVTVRLLKTSPTNALLSALYEFQRSDPRNHGQNVITIADISRGDVYTCRDVAFARGPANTYGKEGNVIEWEFNVGKMDGLLAADPQLDFLGGVG